MLDIQYQKQRKIPYHLSRFAKWMKIVFKNIICGSYHLNHHLHVRHIKCKAPLQNAVQLFNHHMAVPSQEALAM